MLCEWHDAHPPLAAKTTLAVRSSVRLRSTEVLRSAWAGAGTAIGTCGVSTAPARRSISIGAGAPIFRAQSSAVSPARLLAFGVGTFREKEADDLGILEVGRHRQHQRRHATDVGHIDLRPCVEQRLDQLR